MVSLALTAAFAVRPVELAAQFAAELARAAAGVVGRLAQPDL
jgi:hypothetical protein